MIRATGRLRNEASPSRTEKNGRLASTPEHNLRLVPELRQSSTPSGSWSPSAPGETTR
jgi:hypothetical protein